MQVTRRHVGERVLQARLSKKWNRNQLARAVGVSKDVIYRLETGSVATNTSLVYSIARALGTSAERLLAPGPRLRMRQPANDTKVELPVVVTQLLMTGRLGAVTPNELESLVRLGHQEMFADDAQLLELEFLWRRACGAMHKPEFKQQLDQAFERIRQELQDSC